MILKHKNLHFMKNEKQSILLLCRHINWSYSILNYLKNASKRVFTKKYEKLLFFGKSFFLDKNVTKDVFHNFKNSTVFVFKNVNCTGLWC